MVDIFEREENTKNFPLALIERTFATSPLQSCGALVSVTEVDRWMNFTQDFPSSCIRAGGAEVTGKFSIRKILI